MLTAEKGMLLNKKDATLIKSFQTKKSANRWTCWDAILKHRTLSLSPFNTSINERVNRDAYLTSNSQTTKKTCCQVKTIFELIGPEGGIVPE